MIQNFERNLVDLSWKIPLSTIGLGFNEDKICAESVANVLLQFISVGEQTFYFLLRKKHSNEH